MKRFFGLFVLLVVITTSACGLTKDGEITVKQYESNFSNIEDFVEGTETINGLLISYFEKEYDIIITECYYKVYSTSDTTLRFFYKTSESKAFVRCVVLPAGEIVIRENKDNYNFTVAKEDNEVHIVYAPPADIEITEEEYNSQSEEYNDARSRISKEIKTNSLKDTIKANVPYSIKDDFLMISGEKASYYFKSNEKFYKFPIWVRTLNEINTSNLLKMNFTGIEFGCIILDDPNK